VYQKDLDALLLKDSSGLPCSFLLFGYCRYLSTLYCERLLTLFSGESDTLKMYFDEYNFESAKNFLSQSSLFGDKLILVVKNDKKIPKKDVKELIEAAQRNNGLFIFEYFGDISVNKEDYHKTFSSFTRFFQPNNLQEIVALARTEATKYNLSIEDKYLSKIAYAMNMDLELISNEIRKLSALDLPIDDEIIKNVVLNNENINSDKFYELVLLKKSFAQELEFILEKQGSSEVDVTLGFERFVYDILLTKLSIKLFGDAKSAFGYNPPQEILKMRQTLAVSIKDDNLTKILDTLLQTDSELKKSKNPDKKLLLVQNLIKIQSFL